MRHLNFITDIQRIPVENLPFDALLGNKTFSLPDNLDWEKVTFKRPAKLEITEKVDDKVRTYTHKRTYSTCEEDIDTDTIYAYLVTDIDGRKRLLGIPSRPYPIATVSEVHPDSYGTSTLNEVAVSWTATRKAPLIQ